MATTKKTTTKKPALKKAEKMPKAPDPIPSEEEYVDYIIPLDPSLGPNDQFFEYNKNGITYRHRRGVLLHHPKKHANAVMRKLRMISSIQDDMAEYRNMKKLN